MENYSFSNIVVLISRECIYDLNMPFLIFVLSLNS